MRVYEESYSYEDNRLKMWVNTATLFFFQMTLQLAIYTKLKSVDHREEWDGDRVRIWSGSITKIASRSPRRRPQSRALPNRMGAWIRYLVHFRGLAVRNTARMTWISCKNTARCVHMPISIRWTIGQPFISRQMWRKESDFERRPIFGRFPFFPLLFLLRGDLVFIIGAISKGTLIFEGEAYAFGEKKGKHAN